MARLREVFNVFASPARCRALTKEKTQNVNYHCVRLCHNSPKEKFVGQKSIACCTALAVSTLNEGSISFAAVLQGYGIPLSYSTVHHLVEKDKTRNLKRKRAILQTQRRRRCQLAVCTKAAEFSAASKYSGRKFGTERLTIPPAPSDEYGGEDYNTTCSKCDLRTCQIGWQKKTNDWIGCDLCQRWYHGRCVGVKRVSAFTDVPIFCENCEDSSYLILALVFFLYHKNC